MQKLTLIIGMMIALMVFGGVKNAYAEDCLTLGVSDLVVGEAATFEVDGAEEDSWVIVVWGLRPGETKVENDFLNLCATFGIANVKSKVRVVGLTWVDDDGHASFQRRIPDFAGTTVLLQAAQTRTCPDSCVSNIVERTIEGDN